MRTNHQLPLAAAALLALAAACSSPAPPAPPPPSATPTASAAPGLPGPRENYHLTCTAGLAYREAPAYAGPGPHEAQWLTIDPGGMPDDPIHPPLDWYTESVANAQVVVCITTRRGPRARTCPNPGTAQVAPLYYRDYTLTLRETRTAREIATVTLRGNDTVCAAYGSGSTPQFTIPTATQLTDTLRPYLAAPAR